MLTEQECRRNRNVDGIGMLTEWECRWNRNVDGTKMSAESERKRMEMKKKYLLAVGSLMLCMLAGCATVTISDSEHKEVEQTGMSSSEETAQGETASEETIQEETTSETVEAIPVFSTVNLMEGVEAELMVETDVLPQTPMMKFGVPLFQNAVKGAKEGENVLVSPLSAWTALCMAEQGAAGKTKEQMEQVLHISAGDNHLNYGYQLIQRSTESEEGQLQLANGIWIKNVNTLHVKDEFLKKNKTYFDATAYLAPFDETTLQDINHWVAEKTDGMIEEILKEIRAEEVMYLVNALSFDAEWQRIYNETEVWDDIFTSEDGTEQLVPMLHSKESVYLEDETAVGFMKYYKGQQYAFVALLPNEGLTMAEYVEGLTADTLQSLFENAGKGSVEVTMPKFSVDYGFSLKESLMQMGMTDAFSEDDADFHPMATSDIGNIYISRVEQNCFIAVDERGTKAGAATAVAMANKMALMNTKKVNLNRPFVYLIVECDNYEPLFLGTLMNAEN